MPGLSNRVGLFFLILAGTGVAAVLGSFLGHAVSQQWLFIGAAFGGIVGSVCAIQGARWLRWISREQQLPTVIGSLAGFGLATVIAVNNLHTPVIPVLSTALIGMGAVLGSLSHIHWPREFTEAFVNKHLILATIGAVSLLPASILVFFGLSGNTPPNAITQPAFILGGLALAALLNGGSVLRFHVHREDGNVVGSMRMRVRGGLVNWGVVAASICLGGIIMLYLFVENFQPR